MKWLIFLALIVWISIFFFRRDIQKKIYQLTVLRLELGKLKESNKIDEAVYSKLLLEIEKEISQCLAQLNIHPNSSKWRLFRNCGWDILKLKNTLADISATAPWEAPSEPPPLDQKKRLEQTTVQTATPPPSVSKTTIVTPIPPPLPTIKKPAIQDSPKTPAAPILSKKSQQESQKILKPPEAIKPESQRHSSSISISPDKEPREQKTTNALPSNATHQLSSSTILSSEDFAWKSKKKSPIEHVLQRISGWSNVFTPFLVQNIGWFISIISFVAGSILLITYTAGFIRSLIIGGVLFGYTLLMIIGSYVILKRQTELRTVGHVLITIGMLMIPLSIAGAIRIVDISYPSGIKSGIGLILFLINVGVFYWITQLASGMVSRSLTGLHPRLFLILASLQVTVPMLSRNVDWYLIATVHGALLGILMFGIYKFITDWLSSIFVERKKVAFYGAGTLVYASVVSFIHCSWSFQGHLPQGYTGVFLMFLTGMLFYIDSHFQNWMDQYPLLTKFTFACYALSILSIVIAFQSYSTRIISLFIGTVIYASVFWQYITVPPLYLLIACLSLLYHQVVLTFFSNDMYFLASLPGLCGLFLLYRWFLKRKGVKLASLIFRSFVALTSFVLIFSLFYASAGLSSMISGIMATCLFYILLRYTPLDIFEGANKNGAKIRGIDLMETPLFYAVPILSGITLAYMPVIFGIGWIVQFAITMTAHSIFWTWMGFRWLPQTNRIAISNKTNLPIYFQYVSNSECAFNIGIFSAITGIISAYFYLPVNPLNNPFLIPIMLFCGGVLLWLSIGLRIQSLFYTALILEGIAGAFIKLTYFPGPSVGLAEMILSMAFFIIIRWVDRIPDEFANLLREVHDEQHQKPIIILWTFPTRSHLLVDVIKTPLQQAMCLLWAWALGRIFIYVAIVGVSWTWIINSGLGMLMTMVIFSYFGWITYWWLSLMIGLFSWAGFCWLIIGQQVSIGITSATAYALIVWLGTRKIITSSKFHRIIGFLRFEKLTPESLISIERLTHRTACWITVLTGVSIFYWLATRSVSILPAIVIASCFFGISAHSYRKTIYTYGTLVTAIWGTFVIYIGFFAKFSNLLPVGSTTYLHLPILPILETISSLTKENLTGFLMIVLCIGMLGIERIISIYHEYQMIDPQQPNDHAFAHSIFRKPLCVTGAFLSIASGVQQIWIMSYLNELQALSALNLILGAIGLLMCNRMFKITHLNLIGVSMIVAGILSAETLLFHYEAIFAFLTFKQDQWITVGLVTLCLSTLAVLLNRHIEWKKLYGIPIWRVSVVMFCFSLVKAIPSFFSAFMSVGDQFLDLIFFIILFVSLFPLLYPLKNGIQIRGIGILLVLSAIVFQVGSVGEFYKWSLTSGAIWAFVLWGLAEFGIPYFNRMFPEWAIDSTTWSWAGLVLILSNLFIKTIQSSDALLSFYPKSVFSAFSFSSVILAGVYCDLMTYSSRRTELSWITVGCAFITVFKMFQMGFDHIGIHQNQWLSLACLCVGSILLTEKNNWMRVSYYQFPLTTVARIGYVWALIGVIGSINSIFPFYANMITSVTFIVLLFGIFLIPIYQISIPLEGIGLFILLTASIFCCVSLLPPTIRNIIIGGYPYVQWGVSEFVIPKLNRFFPKYQINTTGWYWIGLVLVILIVPLTQGLMPNLFNFKFWLFVSIYLFMMLRNSSLPFISWTAIGTLTIAVILGIIDVTSDHSPFHLSASSHAGIILWSNFLLLNVQVLRKFSEEIQWVVGWKNHNLETPCVICSIILTFLCLTGLIISDVLCLVFGSSSHLSYFSHLWIPALLAGTWYHLLRVQAHLIYAHFGWASIFWILYSSVIREWKDICHIALVSAIWSIFLIGFRWLTQKQSIRLHPHMIRAGDAWISVFPWICLIALVILPVKTLAESLLVLALLVCIMTYLGQYQEKKFLIWVSRLLLLIFIHTWPMMFVPSKKVEGLALWQIWPLIVAKLDQLQILFPWYSLQLMILTYILLGLRKLIIKRYQQYLKVLEIIPINIKMISVLSVLEWILHTITFINRLDPLPPSDAWIHGMAAIITSCLILGIGIRQLIRTQKLLWMYAIIGYAGLVSIYTRLLIFGMMPLTIWDTIALMVLAVILLFIQRITQHPLVTRPVFQTCVIVPILALLTVPWEFESIHAGTTLLTAGALYLSLYYSTGKSSLLYSAFAMINGSMYLWAPIWATRYDLIQLYVVPMSVSVLLMLELHKKELKKSVLKGARLAAICALYLSALVDVFIRPDIWIFVLALILSLLGIGFGIALRIRAFLYGGVIFLILNIVGQLIRLYPEDRLGKGIALIVLGVVMLGMMIGFNIKREAILKRIRIFRSDLEMWE